MIMIMIMTVPMMIITIMIIIMITTATTTTTVMNTNRKARHPQSRRLPCRRQRLWRLDKVLGLQQVNPERIFFSREHADGPKRAESYDRSVESASERSRQRVLKAAFRQRAPQAPRPFCCRYPPEVLEPNKKIPRSHGSQCTDAS